MLEDRSKRRGEQNEHLLLDGKKMYLVVALRHVPRGGFRSPLHRQKIPVRKVLQESATHTRACLLKHVVSISR